MIKFRRKKLHPIKLTLEETKAIKEYAACLGYELGYREVNGMVLPTIEKEDRMGFIQRGINGFKAIYQQKTFNLQLAMEMNNIADQMGVKKDTQLYAFLAGLPDLEYQTNFREPKSKYNGKK
jgi:hypothetical protein